jgi:hypothetical protein
MKTLKELFNISEEDLTEREQKKPKQVSRYEIYCDLDGVLSDFDLQFEKFSGMSPDEYEQLYGKRPFWNLVAEIGEVFWSGMPMMPEGKKLWEYLVQYNPTILSSPSREQHSKDGKSKWVTKHLRPTPKLIFARAEEKHQYSGRDRILVDDREDTIARWNAAGGIGILCKNGDTKSVIDRLTKLGL